MTRAAKLRVLERCRQKGVTRLPAYFTLQFLTRIFWTQYKESTHKAALIKLAKQATHLVWDIPLERLDGALTRQVQFGNARAADSFRSSVLRAGAAGYGGVLQADGQFKVVGKAWLWPLLSHELVKGTVELICLHGMADWDESTYRQVMQAADRIEYEPWMLQAGCELWRQLLPLLPDQPPVAAMVMRIAKLPPTALESLMLAVVEDPDWARELLAGLGRELV